MPDSSIEIILQPDNHSRIVVVIHEESPGTLALLTKEEAQEYGESPYQLLEGERYEYELPPGYSLERSPLVQPSRIRPHNGRILTNTSVGLLELDVLYRETAVGKLQLEICSAKTGYRTDYRKMLEAITRQCSDLLLRHSSPVSQRLTTDRAREPETLYQRFLYIDAVIRSEEFANALRRIVSLPARRWETTEKRKEIYAIRRVTRSIARQLREGSGRVSPQSDPASPARWETLPHKVTVTDKQECTDIPENRFVKHLLESFLQVCLAVYRNPRAGVKLRKEALAGSERISRQLSLPFFQGLSTPDTLPLNSTVLQRKEGYRELLRYYLTADMAAGLSWNAADEVYKGGKRDVALLYEYWLFFKFMELMEEVFGIRPSPVADLIVPTGNRLELTLKKGELKVIAGVFTRENRSLHIEFSYNRTFSGNKSYPEAGSWSREMRPDYTLSFWPESLTKAEAERTEQITHLHFDAKYKVESYRAQPKETERQEAVISAHYTRADLLKMHAYKDAIRRTAGAYILYPGTEKQVFRSFRELLPGVGAFAVSPANDDYTGLKQFLLDVAGHLLNRASQREHYAHHTFRIFREAPAPALYSKLPVDNGMEFPGTTFVLVGYYTSKAHLQWILTNRLYNVRAGSLPLCYQTTTVTYLLLHGKGEALTSRIYRLEAGEPRMVSGVYLKKKEFPSSRLYAYYLCYSLRGDETVEEAFGNVAWDITRLTAYPGGGRTIAPFTVTLEELTRVARETAP